MGKLVIIVGKSGTGKDTLYRGLLADDSLALTPVIPYTTRPMRAREIEGAQYRFISEEELDKMERRGELVEKRSYQTVAGIWSYATARFAPEAGHNRLLITTPAALPAFASAFGSESVVILLLTAPDRMRLERSIHREGKQPSPRFDEVCRRYLADEADFAGLALEKYGTVRTVDTSGEPADTAAAAKAALCGLL